MNTLKLLKKYLIDSQIFVAAMGTSLAIFFMLEQKAFRLATIGLLFSTYCLGYLLTKYESMLRLRTKLIITILSICFFGSYFLFFDLQPWIFLKWVVIIAIGTLYNNSWMPIHVRKIPYAKIFHVALIWSLMNSWLIVPMFNFGIFFITFFYISALIIPFDIRDLKVDPIKTFPNQWGQLRSVMLAMTFMLISALLAHIIMAKTPKTALTIACCISGILIFIARKKRAPYFYYVYIEFCSFLPLLFLVLLK